MLRTAKVSDIRYDGDLAREKSLVVIRWQEHGAAIAHVRDSIHDTCTKLRAMGVMPSILTHMRLVLFPVATCQSWESQHIVLQESKVLTYTLRSKAAAQLSSSRGQDHLTARAPIRRHCGAALSSEDMRATMIGASARDTALPFVRWPIT